MPQLCELLGEGPRAWFGMFEAAVCVLGAREGVPWLSGRPGGPVCGLRVFYVRVQTLCLPRVFRGALLLLLLF